MPLPSRARFVAATLLFGLACGGRAVIDRDAAAGGSGGATVSSTVAASSTGAGTNCNELDEADCDATAGCVPLYDWRGVMPESPPPPPDTPPTTPCCQECMAEPCTGCHIPTFSWCVSSADRCAPPPAGVCGFPDADCP